MMIRAGEASAPLGSASWTSPEADQDQLRILGQEEPLRDPRAEKNLVAFTVEAGHADVGLLIPVVCKDHRREPAAHGASIERERLELPFVVDRDDGGRERLLGRRIDRQADAATVVYRGPDAGPQAGSRQVDHEGRGARNNRHCPAKADRSDGHRRVDQIADVRASEGDLTGAGGDAVRRASHGGAALEDRAAIGGLERDTRVVERRAVARHADLRDGHAPVRVTSRTCQCGFQAATGI